MARERFNIDASQYAAHVVEHDLASQHAGHRLRLYMEIPVGDPSLTRYVVTQDNKRLYRGVNLKLAVERFNDAAE